MSIEAMKLALEALETPKPLDDYPPILNAYAKTINNAITSLQQAIAKLESQEPAALLANAMRFKLSFDSEGKVNCFWNQKELDGRWVALVAAEDDCHLKLTHPPQRTWQGLTDEEIKTICLENGWDSSWQSMRFAHAIEAKLKERNI